MTSSAKSKVFRVTGIPVGKAELDVQATLADTIHHLLSAGEQQQLNVKIACIPSCDQSKTSSALVEFGGGTPEFLAQLDRDPLSDWQVESGNEDVNFDRHFFGFTQLYSTTPGRPVTADIIAITGLDGHAYGSWRGKGNLGRMWLRDFLSKDLPQCRTMIYGYNSKLSSRGVDTIMDYGREFLERIKRVRYTKELRERPLFFIAHSFGGVILAHSLVKAVQTDERDHATIAALPKATYGILFFATPHKGLLIDDIKRMIAGDDDHPRTELLEQIKARSDLLMYQLINFKNHIRDWKIVSFYETLQTRQLKFNNETQSWSRSGAYLTAVTSDSAILQLPDSMEVKVPVSADHSQIVKFDNRNDDTYQMALRYLMEFEKDAGKIISGRFSTTNILSHTPGTQQRKGAPKSTVPFDRDKNFVGRQDILVALESKFSQVGSHNRVALVGLGGIGKSQIAIEYSYRLRERDPQTWVFWVHAGNAVKFEQAYRSIAATLEFPGWDNPKVDVLGLVSRWLGNVENGPWFMILDNADNIDVFRQTREENSQTFKTPQHATTLSGYIPQTANGSVLITTRDKRAAAWLSGEYENIVSIDLMDEDEAKRLLGMRIPPSLSTELDIGHLVRELEYLPLAITQAAAYISARATRMTVFKYLTLYCQSEANQRRLLDEDSGDLRRDQGVPNSVIRTWRISFDQIQETYTKSAQLLSLMAMLDRQSIPEFLISATYQDPLDFEDALSPLNEFSLITVEKGGKSFEMHRLVQLATRKWLAQRMDIQRWQEEATNALSKEFPSGEHSNWGICETLLPHAREVLKYKPVSSNHFLARGSLLYNMAWYSWRQGRYAIARQQIEESLVIREQQLDSSHKSVIDSAGLLGIVLNAQGKYAEAEAMDRKALAGRETALGPQHPNTLTSVSNLALTLRAQGKYTEAEVMNRKALAGRETVLGLEHSGTLMSVSNLADTLYAQGKYAEAEAMNRKALVSREAALGTEHPDTLMSISNLANTLNARGKYVEAEAMNRKTLASREAVLGLEHPDTLMSISNLANTLSAQGKYAEAEAMNRKTMAGREAALGLEHPETLRSASNLASTLDAQGKYAEAEAMNRKTLAGREAALGLKHPDTLMSVYWLAYQLHGQRKYASASVLYQRACKGYQEVLGADHPTTLACSEHYSAMAEEMVKAQTAMQD